MRDENYFGGRIQRYSRVGLSTSRVAAKVLGRKISGKEVFTPEASAELTAILGNLKGPIMKVAQIMATIPDALPPELQKELAQLQSNAPPMGWSFVKRRMKNELGANWQSKFVEFDKHPSFAASLGQVHMAKTLSGEKAVCKLQYPDMNSVVEADLKQLSLFFALYGRYDKAIQTDNIKKELQERLREELDYVLESQNMRLFHHALKAEEGINVPLPIAELCTDRLLTMNYLEGRPLLQVVEEKQEDTAQIAQNLFKAWYIPLYQYGVIHGDPHPGNYTVSKDGAINLLDFGSVRFFDGTFIHGILQLYEAIRDDDFDKAVHAYESWGFNGLNQEIIGVLNQWAKYVYTPLLSDEVRRIQDTDNAVYGAEVAAKIHQELRRLGGIQPPREFVLIDRAAIGLGSIFMRTRVELNWHQLFHDLIENFSIDGLNNRQHALRSEIYSNE